jgi:hypothetical protein
MGELSGKKKRIEKHQLKSQKTARPSEKSRCLDVLSSIPS